MATIRIKNIGPLKDTDIINLTHVMLIIGEQSTGKSTFLKILCYCRWFEKQVMIGEYEDLHYFSKSDFIEPLKRFHKLSDEYFKNKNKLIDYHGDAIHVFCSDNEFYIEKTKQFEDIRYNSKLSYIPAERNLLSVIPSLDAKYRSSTYDSMFNSVIEFEEANGGFTSTNSFKLSFTDNMEYFHEGSNNYVRLTNKKLPPLLLENTSSGVQSALPLNVIVHYLCSVAGNPAKRTPKAVIIDSSRGFSDDSLNKLNTYLFPQLFIEEPEQHLFPTSQAKLIKDIVSQFKAAWENTNEPGYIVITTHSPYILTQLNVLLKARMAFEKNQSKTKSVIPEECILPLDFYSSYYTSQKGKMQNMMDKSTGLIKGEFLDAVSEETENTLNILNDIIYGE